MRPVAFVTLSAAAGVAALVALGGCSSNSATSADSSTGSDASTDAPISCAGDPRTEPFSLNLTHKGDSAALSFEIVGANFNPPAPENNNTWTVKVLDASGQPVTDAALTFPKQSHPSDPWMPDHSHGALAAKAVNNQDGTYAIAPLYFIMSGVWSLYISAQTASVTDSTTFTFCVGN